MKKLFFIIAVAVVVLLFIAIGSFKGKESPAEDPEITETSKPSKATPVRVIPLEPGDLNETTDLGCILSGWKEVPVVSEAGGRVVSCFVKRGDRVMAGDTLIIFDDELPRCALIEAEAGLEEASAGAEMAAREFERQETLLFGANTSRAMYESAETAARGARAALALAGSGVTRAKRILRETRVTSPFNGILDGLIPPEGMYLPPGQPLLTVIQDDPVKCYAGAAASGAVRIEKGMTAVLSVTAFPGEEFFGEVVAVGARSEPGSGAYPIEMKFSNRDGRLKSGMAGSVSIIRRVLNDVKLVPTEAIVSEDGFFFVWSIENDCARRVAVNELGRSRERVAIECGMEEGAPVIVVGHEFLFDGMPVSIQSEKRRTENVTR